MNDKNTGAVLASHIRKNLPEEGDLCGKSGEAMLIACGWALRAPRLMLLGLGDRNAYDRLRVSDETRSALERCLQLRLERVALAPLGIAPDDIPRHAAALIAGILGADGASSERLTLQFCLPRSEVAEAYRALERACDAAAGEAITLATDDASLAED